MSQQLSSFNPGWRQRGVPSAFKLVKSAFKRILQQFDIHEVPHIFYGLLHDLYYFYLAPKKLRVKCPCCNWTGPAFLSTSNWRAVTFESRCPGCDSRSRHRGLVVLLPKLLENLPGNQLLYFAPEKILIDKIGLLPNLKISTTDIHSVDVDYTGEDIQNLSFNSASFAALVCNHVLEHVPNDQAAIAECARVLMPNGLAIFTIPGDYTTRQTCLYATPDSNGHYRHYGLDIIDQLGRFFEVEPLDMHKLIDEAFKVRSGDYLFVCRKKNAVTG